MLRILRKSMDIAENFRIQIFVEDVTIHFLSKYLSYFLFIKNEFIVTKMCKLENSGVFKVFGPVFLEREKSRSTMQKTFGDWLRVSELKFNVSESRIKMVLTLSPNSSKNTNVSPSLSILFIIRRAY